MAIKVGRVFNDLRFRNLNEDLEKLLYIGIVTSPDLSVVGVLHLLVNSLCDRIDISKSDLRRGLTSLRNEGLIHIVVTGKDCFIIVPEHFETIPKSDASIIRINKELSILPDRVVRKLVKLGIRPDRKVITFNKPSEKEVLDYSLSLGHLIDVKEFISFYESKSSQYNKDYWVDSRGKRVKDWKAKLRNVWCKDENKMKSVEGAPKGFEYFFIKDKDSNILIPDGWKNDLPWSKSIGVDILLKKEYKNLKKIK